MSASAIHDMGEGYSIYSTVCPGSARPLG